jgi:hypothetical protein
VCDKCKGAVEVGEEVADEEAVPCRPEEDKEEATLPSPMPATALSVETGKADSCALAAEAQKASEVAARPQPEKEDEQGRPASSGEHNTCTECRVEHDRGAYRRDGGNIALRCRGCEFPACATCGSESKEVVLERQKQKKADGRKKCGLWYPAYENQIELSI